MSKSEFAQAYTERMFPDIAAPAGYIDPEFEVLFDNFAFDEVITEEGRNVPAKDRFLAILATLVGVSAVDEYALMLPAALNFGLIPDEVIELLYQAVPYLGIGRVRPFFKVTNKIFDYRGETVTDPSRSTITAASRLEKGVEKQVEIFGESVRHSYEEG
ncbi:carboxymuconolactone decarboxylase family protein, partial [Veillonella sp.]|uniref:carboxymuconolactone decarboxylase family protein n=1 Tax=Veillonella sp. TaxID=1926307 RepID=UPI0029060FE6